MKKKGVELSMNVIIIAAIGLLVLVILAVLVINSTSRVPGTMKACSLQGGICDTAAKCTNGQIANGQCDSPLVCCRQFTAQQP